jgi:hypothetical protein
MTPSDSTALVRIADAKSEHHPLDAQRERRASLRTQLREATRAHRQAQHAIAVAVADGRDAGKLSADATRLAADVELLKLGTDRIEANVMTEAQSIRLVLAKLEQQKLIPVSRRLAPLYAERDTLLAAAVATAKGRGSLAADFPSKVESLEAQIGAAIAEIADVKAEIEAARAPLSRLELEDAADKRAAERTAILEAQAA